MYASTRANQYAYDYVSVGILDNGHLYNVQILLSECKQNFLDEK
mgnify:FL=1